MNDKPNHTLKNALSNKARRLKKKLVRLERLSKRISTVRLIYFVLSVILVYLIARTGITWLFVTILLTLIGGFMALVSWHRTIDTAIARFSEITKITEQQLARLQLDWENIPDVTSSSRYNSHPFARDFDIIGKRSLLQLIHTGTYAGSRQYLEHWLLEHEPVAPITGRQQLIKELKPAVRFRNRLEMRAKSAEKKASKSEWSMEKLLQWLDSSPPKNFTRPLFILSSLASANIILLVLYLAGVLAPYVIFTFIIYLLTYNFYSSKVAGLFDEATELTNLLSKFRSILLYLESYPYKKGSKLSLFCEVYHQSGKKPSGYLKSILRISSAASSQGSELVWLLLNGIVPWDMYFARKLDAYKRELKPRLEGWLDRFYELEALSSIANFGWLNPDYTFVLPARDQPSPIFQATGIGHPLIPKKQKIANDVAVNAVGDIQLLTGSNMAGKSTFLRTIGINLCLCFAGAPVDAQSFNTVLFRLFSSINVTDSLDEGLSHFYAEVKRLRALMTMLEKPHKTPLFFFVDEIYRGTNNRERLTGSKAFLKKVAGQDGVGIVSTHDLELAQLEEEISTLSNWHFAETIENGKMHFEYKLKAGPCPSTNALKIMEMEGLPV